MADKYKLGAESQALTTSNGSKPPPAPSASKKLSGSAGLVQDLSNKLAKQRKQLDELVSQNSAKKSTWKWYHVLGLILMNDMIVMLVGISSASAFYGVGPISDGSFKSGLIKAEGLEVVTESGPQHVVFESKTDSSQLTIQAAEGKEAKLVLAGNEAVERFSMVSTGTDYFAIRQAGEDRIKIAAEGNKTDIHINPAFGELVINDDLSLGYDTIRTRNSSLTLQAGMDEDIILSPTGDGIVMVAGALDIDEKLTVGDVDNPLLVVDPKASTVTIGTSTLPASLTVKGTTTLSDTLTIMSGGLEIMNGDVLLGNADVTTDGDLTVNGNVHLGDSASDLITIRGVMEIQDDEGNPVVTVNPLSGDVQLKGALTVEKDAELRGDVVLGSKPTDTVTINAYSTSMNSLVATGFVQLGDDDDDTVTVYGSLRVRNDKNDIVFDIDPYTGNTFTEGSLTVSGKSQFAGSVKLGDAPSDQITVYGTTQLNGDVTMHSSLSVLGDTQLADVYATNVTLTGMLQLRDGSQKVTFSVDPNTGNVFSAGSLSVGGDAVFGNDVVLGSSPADTIRFNGEVQVRASLTAEDDVTIEGNTVVEGLATILGDVNVGGKLNVDGNVFLGSGPEDEVVVAGHLLVKDGPYVVFSVNPTSGDVTTQGSLSVKGKAFFEDTVTVDAPLTVQGDTLIRAGLEVQGLTSIGGNMEVGGDMNVDGELLVKKRLQVDGDVYLGSSNQNEVTVRGKLLVRNAVGETRFSVDPTTGDTYAAGSFLVDGAAVFSNSVTLGSSAADIITVHGTTTLHSDMVAHSDVKIEGKLQVSGDTTMQSDLVVHGNVQLGDDVADTIVVNGDLQITDALGQTKFSVDAKTGDAVTKGSMQVHGNLNVEGYITTPEFVVEQLLVDRVNERTPGKGVMIEGVLFRDGGIEWTKAHEIQELVDGAGVTIEGVNFKNGAVVMTSKRAGASPKGEVDLLTLVNSGHDRQMTDTKTSIKFRQFYHDTSGAGQHAPYDSGSITVGTENDWTEDSATHNAYMSFYTVSQGDMSERLRITSEGDFKLNKDKVILRAKTGNAEIAGDVFVGGLAEARHLTVQSLAAEAQVKVISGGTSDAKVVLVSPFGNRTSTFEIVNDGQAAVNPVLRFTDGVNDLMTLTDLGDTGDLYVSGDVSVGSKTSTGLHSLTVQSGGKAELEVRSGEDSDASVVVTSGVDQRARLVLVDPADDAAGSTFEIFNDGAENTHPALRVSDGTNIMLSVIDMGSTGDLHVTGDGVIGSVDAVGPRTLTVQSNNSASIDIIAGGSSDAMLTITSGKDKRAKLVLVDPAPGAAGSTFEIFNDGALETFPTLRITDGTNTMLTITDRGATGDLAVTGNGLFGGPTALGTRSLTVQSANEARMEVVAGGTSDARLIITSGANQKAKLVFNDPSATGGSTFEILNDGAETAPTLKITDGTNDMLRIIDRGTTGDLIVTGNGLFGGPAAVGARTLTVQSAQQADIQVIAGSGFDASVVVSSGPNQDAKLVLKDPAPGFSGSTFEILNDGSEALPTLRITDGQYTMLKITDTGSTGDLHVTGSGLFGGETIDEDRLLSVQSGREAKLEVISGADYDATVTITAGVDQDARLVLADTNTDGTVGSHFEIVNDGTANTFPALSITDGQYTMLKIVDRGDTGDLLVTGDGTFGGPTAIGPRSLTVQSMEEASVQVISGAASDATVTITAGVDKDAKLVLKDSASGANGATFELLNDGSENTFPTFKITDGTNTMLSVTDKGEIGDLYVSGSATFGGPLSKGDRSITVQSGGAASVDVQSGPGNDAVVTITAGQNQNAKLVLEDPADGVAGSKFEIYNDGAQTTPTLRITDGVNTMMALKDLGTTALLEVTGDGVFGSATSDGPRTLTVQSGGQAAMNVVSGGSNDAVVTISAGADKDAKLVFVDPAAGAGGATFEIVNEGAANANPRLKITDGTNTLVSITDNGQTGDMTVSGTVECVNFQSSGTVTLGNGLEDEIIINGHIRQADLVFDANSDGNALTLHFDDPTSSQTITFPDESGTVLTTTSSFSTLTSVGQLSAGSIAPGFGSIVTSNNIETVGSGSITSGGTFTAQSDFIANGDVYLGDAPTDQIVIKGTVVSDITFAPNQGLSFENAAKDKRTTITASFNPTTVYSPAGDRIITIPDIPSGGTLHVVTKGSGTVSNVNEIAMSVTAGVITSYTTNLGPGADEQLFLSNNLIKTTSVVVATVADFGSGGLIFVFAVKVHSVDNGATIVMRNIHSTASMTTAYKVSFAVFN